MKANLILQDGILCSALKASGEEIFLRAERLNHREIEEKLQGDLEHCRLAVSGDYCVITMTDDNSQWGYTLVWDYVRDNIVHLTKTPFVLASAIKDNKVVNLYLVQYWGHPADLWYSVAPLQMVDAAFEPDLKPLSLSVDEGGISPDRCDITVHGDDVIFSVGKQKEIIRV